MSIERDGSTLARVHGAEVHVSSVVGNREAVSMVVVAPTGITIDVAHLNGFHLELSRTEAAELRARLTHLLNLPDAAT